MGKKLKKLFAEAIKSGRTNLFSSFKPTADPSRMVEIDLSWDISHNYQFLAIYLPDFVEQYTWGLLRNSKEYKNTEGRRRKIGLLLKQKPKNVIRKELIKIIEKDGNKTVKRYFTPKTIMISERAKEQYEDFMNKYYEMRSIIGRINNKSKVQNKKSDREIEKKMRTVEAKRIFSYSNYDINLFYEYFQAKPSFTNIYLSTGLEIFRYDHLHFTTKKISPFTEAIEKLGSKSRNIVFQKSIRGLNLYREYYNYTTEYRSRKKNKIRDPKIVAIKDLNFKGRLDPKDSKDIVPSIKQIVLVYTAFFRCIERSKLKPYNTQKYLDYLHNRFPEIKSKRK